MPLHGQGHYEIVGAMAGSEWVELGLTSSWLFPPGSWFLVLTGWLKAHPDSHWLATSTLRHAGLASFQLL